MHTLPQLTPSNVGGKTVANAQHWPKWPSEEGARNGMWDRAGAKREDEREKRWCAKDSIVVVVAVAAKKIGVLRFKYTDRYSKKWEWLVYCDGSLALCKHSQWKSVLSMNTHHYTVIIVTFRLAVLLVICKISFVLQKLYRNLLWKIIFDCFIQSWAKDFLCTLDIQFISREQTTTASINDKSNTNNSRVWEMDKKMPCNKWHVPFVEMKWKK